MQSSAIQSLASVKQEEKNTSLNNAENNEKVLNLHGKAELNDGRVAEIGVPLHAHETLETDSLNAENTDSEPPPVASEKKGLAKHLDKMMELVTAAAVIGNIPSLISKILKSSKPDSEAKDNGLLDKIALNLTQAQAMGFAGKILHQAWDEKDAMLLLAGLGKVLQIKLAKLGNFLQLGGFQTAFDQLNPGMKKTIGIDKFDGFLHSFKEYGKAFKVILKDMKDDPLGYLKLSPKNGHVERVLVPGAISILGGTALSMLSTDSKPLKVLAGVLRHVTGGILGGDVILGKLTDNKDMNLSGNLYIGASAIDCAANLIKDKAKEDIVHQVGTMFNFVAELFFAKGLEKSHA